MGICSSDEEGPDPLPREEVSLEVKKLAANARLPVLGSEDAAGYDLHCNKD